MRDRPGSYGLVWANGGYCTKHAFGVYSTTPPRKGVRLDEGAIQAEIDALPTVELADKADATGAATVEAYTVMHTRDGIPERVSHPVARELFLEERVRRMVRQLPPRPRMVVTLRYQEDLDPSEIAALLNMSINTVKSDLRRSLAVLRTKLAHVEAI